VYNAFAKFKELPMLMIVAVVLLLQDKTATETLKKIEETIEKAKSFSCSFRAGGTLEHAIGLGGAVVMKAPDKCALRGDDSFQFVSNGEQAVFKSPSPDKGSVECPKEMNSVISANFVRAGAALTLLALKPSDAKGTKREAHMLIFKIRDIINEPRGPDNGALGFGLELFANAPAASVTLWYDLKTFLPVKRRVEFANGDEEFVLTEVYKNSTLDHDIPDEKFKLPEEKK
jgi:outer membrane lipoprotein-sorting protein